MDDGNGEEKKEIKLCRGEAAEVGRQRRIKWRGACDSLASLQRLPAAIQLLLKATLEKGCQQCQRYRKESKEAERRREPTEEGDVVSGKQEQKVNSACSTVKSSTWRNEHILWTSSNEKYLRHLCGSCETNRVKAWLRCDALLSVNCVVVSFHIHQDRSDTHHITETAFRLCSFRVAMVITILVGWMHTFQCGC